MLAPQVKGFFAPDSHTISYVVFDQDTRQSAVIDSVLDFDYASGAISYNLADQIIAYIQKQSLNVVWHIETHVHADHLSAAPYLQSKLGG